MRLVLNKIKLFNKSMDIERVRIQHLMKLLDNNGVEYKISVGSNPVNFNLKLLGYYSNRSCCIELKTDMYCFGFIDRKLRYFVVNCDDDQGIKFIDIESNEIEPKDMFNIILMMGDINFNKCKERFILTNADDGIGENFILKVARLKDKMFMSYEFGYFGD